MKKARKLKKQHAEDKLPNANVNQDSVKSDSSHPVSLSRRAFLGSLGGVAALTLAADVSKLSPLLGVNPTEAHALEIGPLDGVNRRNASARVRHDAEVFNRRLPIPDHPCNGDEDLYPSKIGSYSKGLPHEPDRGEVDARAYNSLIQALTTGEPSDFEAIIMGCPPDRRRRLVNPQAGLAFDLEGTDSHQHAIRAAPAFASAEEAGEIVENYWMALLRDVPFEQYESSSLALEAADDLSRLSDFRGPKEGGRVTPRTLFREDFPSVLKGPYISQFMWLDAPYGANFVEQRMQTTVAGLDYMTSFDEWLDIQNGCLPSRSDRFQSRRRYITNGRHIGQWVHVDVLFQAYFVACLVMASMGVPHNPGNPYNNSATQDGFGTFGGPYFKTLVSEVSTRALKAVWYQKWFVHRRSRPEDFAARVHLRISGLAPDYPIHPDVLNSRVLSRVFDHNSRLNQGNGTYLLPMAFPEGSPLHPAYGAGHATVAGACVTILKALFDESFVIENPVIPHPRDPSRLIPYTGPDRDELTVGGELNKLAINVAFGRNIAGVHWRTDGTESLKLGEAVAISILRDQRATYNEDFGGYTFTKFDGSQITV